MPETSVRSLGWGDSPGEGNCNPLQYSGLENSMDCIVYRMANSRTQLRQLSLSLVYIFASPQRRISKQRSGFITHTRTYQKLSHPYHDLFDRWRDQKHHIWADLGLRRLLTGFHHDQSFGQRTGFASRLVEIQTKKVGVRLSSLLRSISLHTMQADIMVSMTSSFFVYLTLCLSCL